jgi:integrase
LHPLTDSLNFPRGGFHAFRHEMASLLVSTGANPKVAQAQLGHADIKTTMNVYTRLVGNEHREAVEKVAQILRPVVPVGNGKLLRIQ